jgi:hypothetical protein
MRALLVSQDRRHLFVTSCCYRKWLPSPSPRKLSKAKPRGGTKTKREEQEIVFFAVLAAEAVISIVIVFT